MSRQYEAVPRRVRCGVNRLRRARETAGLSIEQVSAKLGWACGTLRALEDGSAKYPVIEESLRALSSLYGCSIAWLRGETAELSADNEALLRTVEHTGDRETLREFMQMISTRDPGAPSPPSAEERLARLSEENADHLVDGLVARNLPVATKVRYVKSQRQTRDHHCHWPGCTKQVPPAMWGCRPHWFSLPKALRDRVWRTYLPGQEVDMSPSAEYLQVADDVQRWIKDNGQ